MMLENHGWRIAALQGYLVNVLNFGDAVTDETVPERVFLPFEQLHFFAFGLRSFL